MKKKISFWYLKKKVLKCGFFLVYFLYILRGFVGFILIVKLFYFYYVEWVMMFK